MQGPASHLHRRHEAGSSHDHSAGGQTGQRFDVLRGVPTGKHDAMALCQSKVQNLHPLPNRNHDVFGFQVAVHDAGGVRGHEGLG